MIRFWPALVQPLRKTRRDCGMVRALSFFRPLFALLIIASPSATLAQTTGEISALRFTYEMATARLQGLERDRNEAVRNLRTVAEQVVDQDRKREERTQLLGQVQQVVEHIAFLDQELEEVAPAAKEARDELSQALRSRMEMLREEAQAADPERREELEAEIKELGAELDRVGAVDLQAERVDPLAVAGAELTELGKIITREYARLRTITVLQDELRLFMGNLRLFDETSMLPSGQGAGGGDGEPDPGCPGSVCPLPGDAVAPADRPMEHFRPETGLVDEDAVDMQVTVASLARLQEQLAASVGMGVLPAGVPAPEETSRVVRETVASAGLMSFRSEGESLTGMAPKISSSLLWVRDLDTGQRITVEPWLGARTARAGQRSHVELAAEIRETLAGVSETGSVRWQVMSWQKGRFLSDALPAPGYLEPGRLEGGVMGRMAVAVRPQWDLEVGSGGDLLRYDPEDWKVLDRQGVSASMGVVWRGGSNTARLLASGSYHGYSHRQSEDDPRRADTRIGMEADWSLEGPLVARFSAGLARNHSRLEAYDYNSGRAAVILSAPVGNGSLQGYGLMARQSYLDSGAVGQAALRSDQETGSVLALQYTQPLGLSRAVTFRAEWSRSETGIRDDFYHRFGTSVQFTFKGLGDI